MLDVKFMADTKVADSKRAFEMQKAAFSQEINVKVCLCSLGVSFLWSLQKQERFGWDCIVVSLGNKKIPAWILDCSGEL